MSELAFRLEGVELRRGGLQPGAPAREGAEQVVFAGLDLALARGGRLALLGESGGGKTSLLGLLNRLCEPSAGEVEVLGRPATEWAIGALRRRVVLVSHPALFGGSVRDELCAAQRWRGEPDPPAAELAALLADLGLGELELEREGSALSAGQRARLCLGRALLLEPELLLLDEPTGALDVRAARELIGLLRGWASERGVSLAIVTHRPADARELQGEVACLLGGRLYGPYPAVELDAVAEPALRAFLDAPQEEA